MPLVMPKPALPRRTAPAKQVAFDAQTFLDSAGVARKVRQFKRGAVVYSQGDSAKGVMYLQQGGVKLSVARGAGKEAGVGIFGGGGLFWGGVFVRQALCLWAPSGS